MGTPHICIFKCIESLRRSLRRSLVDSLVSHGMESVKCGRKKRKFGRFASLTLGGWTTLYATEILLTVD